MEETKKMNDEICENRTCECGHAEEAHIKENEDCASPPCKQFKPAHQSHRNMKDIKVIPSRKVKEFIRLLKERIEVLEFRLQNDELYLRSVQNDGLGLLKEDLDKLAGTLGVEND